MPLKWCGMRLSLKDTTEWYVCNWSTHPFILGVQKQSFMVNQRDFAIKEKKGTKHFLFITHWKCLSQKDILPGEMTSTGMYVGRVGFGAGGGGEAVVTHHFQTSDGLLQGKRKWCALWSRHENPGQQVKITTRHFLVQLTLWRQSVLCYWMYGSWGRLHTEQLCKEYGYPTLGRRLG